MLILQAEVNITVHLPEVCLWNSGIKSLMCVCTACHVTRSKTYNLWVSVCIEQILTSTLPLALCRVQIKLLQLFGSGHLVSFSTRLGALVKAGDSCYHVRFWGEYSLLQIYSFQPVVVETWNTRKQNAKEKTINQMYETRTTSNIREY